jgi:hypothetical protein
MAACPGTHGQIILGYEISSEGFILGRRNGVRNSPAIAPVDPRVTNSDPACLRTGCRNGMARAWHPGKFLWRTISRAIYRECKACDVRLNYYVNACVNLRHEAVLAAVVSHLKGFGDNRKISRVCVPSNISVTAIHAHVPAVIISAPADIRGKE